MQLDGLVKFHPDTSSKEFSLDYECVEVQEVTQRGEGDGTVLMTYAEHHDICRLASDRKLTDTDSGGLDDTGELARSDCEQKIPCQFEDMFFFVNLYSQESISQKIVNTFLAFFEATGLKKWQAVT